MNNLIDETNLSFIRTAKGNINSGCDCSGGSPLVSNPKSKSKSKSKSTSRNKRKTKTKTKTNRKINNQS
jgi:hypothetical protein